MLIPFFSNYKENIDDPDVGRFDEFEKRGKDLFEITTDPLKSDYFLLPFGYSFDAEYKSVINDFFEKACQFSKKILVFYNADDDTPINHKNILVFRTSLNKSIKPTHEYSLPGWSVDFINYFPNKTFYTINDTEKPSVAYCGYIDKEKKGVKTLVKNIIRPTKKTYEDIAKSIRGDACRNLLKNNKVKTNFIIRNGFWAAGIEDKAMAREEYASNMFQSIYAIATRGGGNFSYRLYEIISCGRIPIFINTDSVLPFENSINWKKHVVWVENNEIHKIDEILLNFHNSKTKEQLIELQKQNRILYETKISPHGFFKELKYQLNNGNL